jgi:hypothetical protein
MLRRGNWNPASMLRLVLVMAVVCLAGCSPLWDYSPRSPIDEEADFVRTAATYKKLAIEHVSKLAVPGGIVDASISPLRKSHAVAFADWMACVEGQSQGDGQRRMYALFYRAQKVADIRAAVVIDRCDGETFEKL